MPRLSTASPIEFLLERKFPDFQRSFEHLTVLLQSNIL